MVRKPTACGDPDLVPTRLCRTRWGRVVLILISRCISAVEALCLYLCIQCVLIFLYEEGGAGCTGSCTTSVQLIYLLIAVDNQVIFQRFCRS